MSNFKKFIKEKFIGEVSPEYSDAAWDKFSAFATGQQPKKKERQKRNHPLFWIAINALSCLYLYS